MQQAIVRKLAQTMAHQLHVHKNYATWLQHAAAYDDRLCTCDLCCVYACPVAVNNLQLAEKFVPIHHVAQALNRVVGTVLASMYCCINVLLHQCTVAYLGDRV